MKSYRADAVVGEWRGQTSMVLAVLAAGSVAAIMAAMTILSLVLPLAGQSAAWAIGILFYAPLAYVLGRLTIGFARAGVTISTNAVVVRNPWRTITVPVAHAAGFKATTYGNGNAAVMLSVTTTGSRGAPTKPIILSATYRGGFIWTGKQRAARLEPIAAEMNEALARAQG